MKIRIFEQNDVAELEQMVNTYLSQVDNSEIENISLSTTGNVDNSAFPKAFNMRGKVQYSVLVVLK